MSKFNQLSSVNVNDKLEKKGNQTYLSWAYAWAEAKKLCPDVNRHVYESEGGKNYFTDGRTAWVKVGVTIEAIEHIDYLPIMDMRNNPIAIEKVTSFDVNKAIQRSTTKALAMHGLALYIYAGEELPEGEKKEEVKKEEAGKPLLKLGDDNWFKVIKFSSNNKSKGYDYIVNQLSRKYELSSEILEAIKTEVAS
jgi:hypothetical protein